MSLKQKLITGGAILVSSIGSIFNSGCESYNEYDFLSLASMSARYESETPEDAFAFGVLEKHFQTQANRQDRREVANMSKFNNINNYNQRQVYVPKPMPEEYVVSCTGFRDLNRNGILEDNEFFNLNRQSYFISENPKIVIKVKNAMGQKLRFDAKYTEKLSSVLSQALLGGTRRQSGILEIINSNNKIHTMSLDVPGTFKFDFYAGNRYLGNKIIQVKN